MFKWLSSWIANLRAKSSEPDAAPAAHFAEVKRLNSSDQKRHVTITRSSNGVFRFEEYEWIEPWEENNEVLDKGYWQCIHFSGLYASAQEAEDGARKEIPWIKG